MRYIDGLVNACFTKSQDGSTIFYPYGVLGVGYRVSPSDETQVKTSLRVFYKMFFSVFVLSIVFFKLQALWLLLIICLPWYHLKTRRLLRNAMRVRERMLFQEQTKNMALANGLRTNIVLLSMSILMTSVAVFCLFLPDKEAKIAGVVGTIFFGACLWQSIASVRYSLLGKKSE